MTYLILELMGVGPRPEYSTLSAQGLPLKDPSQCDIKGVFWAISKALIWHFTSWKKYTIKRTFPKSNFVE